MIAFVENHLLRGDRLGMQTRSKHGKVLSRQIAKERNAAQ